MVPDCIAASIIWYNCGTLGNFLLISVLLSVLSRIFLFVCNNAVKLVAVQCNDSFGHRRNSQVFLQ